MKKIRTFMNEYYLIIVLVLLSLYFTYHIFYSKRGYMKLQEIEYDINQATGINEEIKTFKFSLENKVELLSSDSLDIDLLDEMIRHHLNMATKEEYIILK